MDYGSDLDLDTRLSTMESLMPAKRPVPRRILRPGRRDLCECTLSSMTRDGSLYRVDLRLRPYGKNGTSCDLKKRIFGLPAEQRGDLGMAGLRKDPGSCRRHETRRLKPKTEACRIIHQNAMESRDADPEFHQSSRGNSPTSASSSKKARPIRRARDRHKIWRRRNAGYLFSDAISAAPRQCARRCGKSLERFHAAKTLREQAPSADTIIRSSARATSSCRTSTTTCALPSDVPPAYRSPTGSARRSFRAEWAWLHHPSCSKN